MAVLGFSHITSEVVDLDSSIAHYQKHGFKVKFCLDMDVPEIKQKILTQSSERMKIAYLTYGDDEACNLEIMAHDNKKVKDKLSRDHIDVCFRSELIKGQEKFQDLDGNQFLLRSSNDEKEQYAKEFHLRVTDLEESARFYKEIFGMQELEFSDSNQKVLGFSYCLHENWDGRLNLVKDMSIAHDARYLDDIGFHSFCFLISSVEEDIYSKVEKDRVIAPIRETKNVNGKDVAFEVGFINDPDGYPIEYLVLNGG